MPTIATYFTKIVQALLAKRYVKWFFIAFHARFRATLSSARASIHATQPPIPKHQRNKNTQAPPGPGSKKSHSLS